MRYRRRKINRKNPVWRLKAAASRKPQTANRKSKRLPRLFRNTPALLRRRAPEDLPKKRPSPRNKKKDRARG
jgi:hypothetical protein